jgi:hypothetical protein
VLCVYGGVKWFRKRTDTLTYQVDMRLGHAQKLQNTYFKITQFFFLASKRTRSESTKYTLHMKTYLKLKSRAPMFAVFDDPTNHGTSLEYSNAMFSIDGHAERSRFF